MARLSADGTYVTVESGDNLWNIAKKYVCNNTTDNSRINAAHNTLAQINNLSNPNLIHPGQIIYLTSSAGSSGGSSGGSSTTTTTPPPNKAVITAFGLQADVDDTLYATWTFDRPDTDCYKLDWRYNTQENVWMYGNDGTTTYKYSTYKIPENARQVNFRVKPIAKKETKERSDGSTYEVEKWTAEWTDWKRYNINNQLPPDKPGKPPAPTIDGYILKVEINGLASDLTSAQFQICRDNSSSIYLTSLNHQIANGNTYCSWTVPAGSVYKYRYRVYRGAVASEWSDWSDNKGTVPAAPGGITSLKALSATKVRIDWTAVPNATKYDVEYTTNKAYFDSTPSKVQSVTDIATTYTFIEGIEESGEYFFRVRAKNDNGESGWTPIKSIVLGEKPAPPTTWSLTTTVMVGEDVVLYWVHNSQDGSAQTAAVLDVKINNVPLNIDPNQFDSSDAGDDENKTNSYVIPTDSLRDGAVIVWKVKTKGVLAEYSDWSVERTINVYAPPTVDLDVTNQNGTEVSVLTGFPFYVRALAGPNTQMPIGYHVSILSNDTYETVDAVGNPKMINVGEAVYSKFFDTSDRLVLKLSASNVDLQNGMTYTLICTAAMDSGLSGESSVNFTVSWTDQQYIPNAEIGVDTNTYAATIRPYCGTYKASYRKVNYAGGKYTVTSEEVGFINGTEVKNAKTTTGEQVFKGSTGTIELVNGNYVVSDQVSIYYCIVEDSTLVPGVKLSVYRREFNGDFVEIATDLDNVEGVYVIDPHPALDYARYRIVATTDSTGAVSYYDVPNYPVGGKAVLVQWDESWSNFSDVGSYDDLVQPPWTGSMLKLPYNIDVSDKNTLDVSLVEYTGRKHPVSYYGTQLGETSTWNTVIPKYDKETLYGLRRLAIWTGDVYVREPSGSGYWANISVSFNVKHLETTIPVTLTLTRVEGGV